MQWSLRKNAEVISAEIQLSQIYEALKDYATMNDRGNTPARDLALNARDIIVADRAIILRLVREQEHLFNQLDAANEMIRRLRDEVNQ